MHIDYLIKQMNKMEAEQNKEFDIKSSFIFKIFQFCYITQQQISCIRFEKDYDIDFTYIWDKNTQKIMYQKRTTFNNLDLENKSQLLNLSCHFDNFGYNIGNIKILDNQFKQIFMEKHNTIIYIGNANTIDNDNKTSFKSSRSFLIISMFLDLILSKIGDEWQYGGKTHIGKIIDETYNEYFNSLEEYSVEENESLIQKLSENNDETWFKQNMMKMFTDLKNGRNQEEWYQQLIEKIK